MSPIDGRLWHVREGKHYVFHLEPPLDEDAELAACLIAADERYPQICRLLGHDEPSVKESERFVKTNYWLPDDPRTVTAAKPAEVMPGGAPDRAASQEAYSTGSDTEAGIVFAQQGIRWTDVIDQMTHEEIHAVWRREVGAPPALLTEGVAFWCERRLSRLDRWTELEDAWREVVANGRANLRDLATSKGFWAIYREGHHVYAVGACLTGYLIDAHGLDVLKEIHRASCWDDDDLAALIERQTGESMETIETRVSEWLPRRLAVYRAPASESTPGVETPG